MALVKVLNPKLNVTVPPEIVFEGAKINSYVQALPNALSNTNNVITVTSPNRSIGIARGIQIAAEFTAVITLTNTSGGVPFPDGYLAPRLAPLGSVITTQTMVINNMNVQQSTSNQSFKPLMQYLDNYNQRYTTFSTFPSMMDQTQQYSIGLNSNRNPLASDLNNSYDVTRNNAGVLVLTGNTAGSTSVTALVRTTEPLFLLSPFSSGSDAYHDSVLFHVDQLTWTMSLSNLNRVLSISDVLPAGVAITSVTTNLTSLQMLLNYITPQVGYEIPQHIKYSSFTPQLYTTTIQQVVAPGGSMTGTTQSIQLQGVPQKVFIWATHADSARATDPGAYQLTDSVMALKSLNCFYNTQIFLSGATQQDLYNIAVKNGSRLSYDQWTNRMGSVLSLSFGDDIGLSRDEAPGLQGMQQIYFTGTWTQPTTGATISNPQIYVLVIYGGSIEDHDGQFVLYQNTVTHMDMQQAGISDLSFKQSQPLVGGGFLDILKKAASPLLDIATPVLSGLFPEAAPFIGPARKFLGVGHGCGGASSGGAYSGGLHTGAGMKTTTFGAGGGRPSKSRRIGGKAFPSKAQLMQM